MMQANFKQHLLSTITEIENLWLSLKEDNQNSKLLSQLHHVLLRLADAGGTYGADEVSFLARKLDIEFKPLLDKSNPSNFIENLKEKWNDIFSQLRKESEEWVASKDLAIKTNNQRKKMKVT